MVKCGNEISALLIDWQLLNSEAFTSMIKLLYRSVYFNQTGHKTLFLYFTSNQMISLIVLRANPKLILFI